MDIQKELDEFVGKIETFNANNAPSFLTPNSYFVGIVPGHNLDLLQISFDYRIDRSQILKAETPEILKDPSKVELTVIR